MLSILRKYTNDTMTFHFHLKEKNEKVEKLVVDIHEKTEYALHIRNLKQAPNHSLVLKKVHMAISFNQDEWLKPYIKFNTELTKTAKNEFEKYFFKLMNNAIFERTIENIRKYKDIKLVKTERRMHYLVSELNFYST